MKATHPGGGRKAARKTQSQPYKNPSVHPRLPVRTLQERPVRTLALAWLLPLLATALRRTFSPATLRDTADLLLRAAATRSSVHAARSQCRRGRSDRTARWLFSALVLGKTQRAVTLALRRQIRPFLPTDPVDIAIDDHDRPDYGQPQDPRRKQVVKTKEERGTHRAHRFASLSVLLPNFRLVASLRFRPKNGGTLASVQKALHDFHQAGGTVRDAFLDRGYYAYDVLTWLTAQVAAGKFHGAVVAMRLGSRQRKRWVVGKKSYATTHTMKGPTPGAPPLTFTVHVVVRYQMGRKWKKHGCQYFIDAVFGDIRLTTVADRYRRRFGIESSYRILGQAMARTTSRSSALRLLHVAIGMMLQNEWVLLKLHYASERRSGPIGFVVREELLRFGRVLEMLLRAVGYRLGHVDRVENRRPWPTRLRRQGLSLY